MWHGRGQLEPTGDLLRECNVFVSVCSVRRSAFTEVIHMYILEKSFFQ